MNSALLSVHGVSASYSPPGGGPQTRVLEEITFEVGPGERLGLVGQSGSGKSTLARVLVGLHAPDAGTILLNGTALGTLSDAERRALVASTLRLVFQHPDAALNAGRTVRSTLRQALHRHSRLPTSAYRDRIASLLRRAGLPEAIAGAYPNQLSGGEKRRVGLCRALATEPALLIADELTSGLDPLLRRHLLDVLETELRPRRASVLLISHDLGSVLSFCDRIGVMHDGRIVDLATPATLRTSAVHPQTRRLLEAHDELSLGHS